MDERRAQPGGPGSASREPAEAPADPTAPHAVVFETCYRHPEEVTGVHCTRCGRPICPECMHPAAVGYQCPNCLAEARRSAPRTRSSARSVLRRPGSVTTLLMATNGAMFVLTTVLAGGLAGAGPDANVLVDLGASHPRAIASGQYWRLVTAIFLHSGLLHIAFNLYALYLFGHLVEGAFGTGRFVVLYLLSGFLASVASYATSSPFAVGVGASGAIFGLLGAWLAFNYRRRESAFASAQLRWVLMLVGINLVLGFTVPNIDNSAHIGGLVSGAAIGWLFEGFGPRRVRDAVSVLGPVALALAGVAVVAARTAALT